jgi:hypothetical protein
VHLGNSQAVLASMTLWLRSTSQVRCVFAQVKFRVMFSDVSWQPVRDGVEARTLQCAQALDCMHPVSGVDVGALFRKSAQGQHARFRARNEGLLAFIRKADHDLEDHRKQKYQYVCGA